MSSHLVSIFQPSVKWWREEKVGQPWRNQSRELSGLKFQLLIKSLLSFDPWEVTKREFVVNQE